MKHHGLPALVSIITLAESVLAVAVPPAAAHTLVAEHINI